MKYQFFAIIFFLQVPFLHAQDAPAPREEMNVVTLLEKGGWIMLVLAFISVVTLMLILLYFLTIRRSAVVTNKFMNASEAMIRKRDYLGLIAFCHRRNESVARVTHKMLDFLTKNPNANHADIREVAEAEASRQASALTQRISYLADRASIAPMVGLLGTVIGMIKAFMDISEGRGEGVKQLEMAKGVWEALVTTAGGLSIGIVAIMFYSIFRGRVSRLIAELESASTHILAITSGQLQSHRVSPGSYAEAHEDYHPTGGPSPMRELRGEH